MLESTNQQRGHRRALFVRKAPTAPRVRAQLCYVTLGAFAARPVRQAHTIAQHAQRVQRAQLVRLFLRYASQAQSQTVRERPSAYTARLARIKTRVA